MAYTNKIICISGQSNSVGREDMANLNASYTGTRFSNRIWTGTNYACVNSSSNNNQYNQASNQYGLQFYLEDYATQLKRDIYLQQFGVGGTSLATVAQGGTGTNWNVSTPASLYVQLQTTIAETKSYMNTRGKLYKFEVMIWLQGENDAGDATAAANYQTNLFDFYAAVNADIGGASSPIWIIPKLSGAATYVPDINAAFVALQAANPAKVFLLETSGYGKRDGVHYNDAGFRSMTNDILTIINANVTP